MAVDSLGIPNFYKGYSIQFKWNYARSAKLNEERIFVIANERTERRLFSFQIDDNGIWRETMGYSVLDNYSNLLGSHSVCQAIAISDTEMAVLFQPNNSISKLEVIKVGGKNDSLWHKQLDRYPHFASHYGKLGLSYKNGGIKLSSTDLNTRNTFIVKIPSSGELNCNETDIPIDTAALAQHFDSIPEQLPLPVFTTEFTIRDTIMEMEDAFQEIDVICSDIKIPKVELGNDTLICAGSFFQLNAGNPLDSFSYNWSTGDTVAEITATASGRYRVEVSNGGCTATDSIDLVFLNDAESILPHDTTLCPYDSLEISIPNNGNYRLVTPQNDTLLCYNQEYIMQGAGGITYHWIPSTYLSNDTIPDPVAQLPHKQNYILIVGNNAGCRDTSGVSLEVRPPLGLHLRPSDTTVCKGDRVHFAAMATGGDSTAYLFSWDGNAASGPEYSQVFNDESWIYVKLEDGCSQEVTDSAFVKVAAPEAAFTVQPDDTGQVNKTLNLINHSTNAAHYSWDLGNGENSTAPSPAITYRDTGRFQIRLVAFSAEGCADTAFQWVWVLPELNVFIPNAFHPGGGINDIFAPTSSAEISWHLEVYNRWGQKGWDGMYKGASAPEGVYVYKLQLLNVDTRSGYFRGNVHLLR